MQSRIQALLDRHPLVDYIKVDSQENNHQLKIMVTPKPSTSCVSRTQHTEEDLLQDQELYLLPNGYRIVHQSLLQTNIIYPEIFNAVVYLRHGITLFPGASVFDVGANIGLFTLFAYEKCHGKAQIYSFEPSPPTFEVLQKNIQLLGLGDQVKPFRRGLSHTSTTAPFVFFPHMSGMSGPFSDAKTDKQAFVKGICSWLQEDECEHEVIQFKKQLDEMLDSAFAQSETYQCEFTTISQVIKENHVECIDLLKIDVERCEIDVLLGIEKKDWKKIRQIVAEVHSKFLLDQVTKLLESKGYHIVVEEERGIDQVMEHTSDMDYKLYMVYAVRRQHKKQEAGQSNITYITTKRPLLSMKELRKFLQGEVPNYILLSELRHLLKENFPEMLPYAEFDLIPSLNNGKIEDHLGDLIVAAH